MRSFGDSTVRDAEKRFRSLDPCRRVVDHADHLHVRAPLQPGQVAVRANPAKAHDSHSQSAHFRAGIVHLRKKFRPPRLEEALSLHSNRR